MIGEVIAAVLPLMQAQAESRMVDTVRVVGRTEPEWDEGSGTYKPGATVTVYEGKARVRNANPAPQDADAGETMWAKDLAVISVPLHDADTVAGSVDAIEDGMDVEVIAVGAGSASKVGRHYTVQAPHEQTDSTARRFSCQVVTRDA